MKRKPSETGFFLFGINHGNSLYTSLVLVMAAEKLPINRKKEYKCRKNSKEKLEMAELNKKKCIKDS